MEAWKFRTFAAPAPLDQSHREADLLWYGPTTIIAADTSDGAVGAIRFALRENVSPPVGLITDLIVDRAAVGQGLEATLISAATEAAQGYGAKKAQALVRGGVRSAIPFLDAGFELLRKTVVLEFDLARERKLLSTTDYVIEVVDHIDPEAIANFIFDSYQPYWQWWKETGEEQPLGRVEYFADTPAAPLEKAKEKNRPQVLERLRAFNTVVPQRLVIARQQGRIVGMCDAIADSTDSMEWGVLVRPNHPGKALGSVLLGAALDWLREQGLKTAQVTTTSGLDDYDPTVYLYTVVGGAQIRGEFFVLRKTSR